MWTCGEVFGIRWEVIENNHKIEKCAAHKAGREIKVNNLLKLYVYLRLVTM